MHLYRCCQLQLGSLGGPKDPNTAMRGRMGMAPMPGSTLVLDRATRTLVPCTAQLCPLATDTLLEVGRSGCTAAWPATQPPV